ncbi:MAG: type I-E CRISPR-associated protein Cse1/CasA [Pirellulales bacterium]
MNVAFDMWIPVVKTCGERRLVSLCDVLARGEEFADLAVRPHERVALMRLLTCVAHAALDGPKDYEDWCRLPSRLPSAATQYLEKWRDSFEVFHPVTPWLQVAGLSKSEGAPTANDDSSDWTSTSKLNFSLATGNTTTLFDHAGMRQTRCVAAPDLVLSMLTYQCFSPGGLIAQVYWAGKQTTKTSKDAPCAPASMVHGLLRGQTLAESVHLNLPSFEDVRLSYGDTPIGRPVWEQVPVSPSDSRNIQNATATYVGRLTPMSRFIRLDPRGDKMLLGSGLVYPTFTDGFPPEPTATVVVRQSTGGEDRMLLSFRPSKALWRELAAIVVKRTSEGSGGPLSLRAIPDGQGCDLIVSSMARDQATVVDTVESVFRIPPRLTTLEGTTAYEAEVKTAEERAGQLNRAVEAYRSALDGGWEGRLKSAGPSKAELRAKLHAVAATHFWTAVEKNLPLLMTHIESLGTDNAGATRSAWHKMLFISALDAFRTACGQETPRQVRAFAEGWKRLVKQKVASPTTGDEEET